MDMIQALTYKYQLNKYIDDCLRAGYTLEAMWEYLSSDAAFLEFLGNKIGHIWLTKGYGLDFSIWANS